MKILVFTKYNNLGPSSYYRVYQFLNLRKEINKFKVSYFWGDYYFKFLISESNNKIKIFKMIPALIIGFIKRIFVTFFIAYKFDIIHIEKDFIPGFPVFFEYFFKFILNKKIVYEIDDAVFLSNYPKSKTHRLIKLADHLIVGNIFLKDYCSNFNSNISVIPTGVDFDIYKSEERNTTNEDLITIGWIGTSSGLNLIKNLEKAFMNIEKKGFNFELKLVCDKDLALKIRNKNYVKWTRENEINDIRTFDIGIMPLDDDEFNKYKCGFKLIQYLACEKPVVASDIGVNSHIVKHGINGFLCKNDMEWEKYLEELICNNNLRSTMGRNSYDETKGTYDIKNLNNKVISIYKNLLDDK